MDYRTALGLALVLGAIPALVFFVTHVPKRWTLDAIDASGMYFIIGLLYLLSLYRLWTGTATGISRQWDNEAVFGMVATFVVDGLLWLRCLHWIWYRYEMRHGRDPAAKRLARERRRRAGSDVQRGSEGPPADGGDGASS